MLTRMIALLACVAFPAMVPVGGTNDAPNRGFLGIMVQPLDENSIAALRAGAGGLPEKERAAALNRANALKPGVLVAGVYKGGPAAAAGLAVDDVILSVAGVAAEAGPRALQAAMRATVVGEAVAVRYLRIDEEGKGREVEASIVPISRDAMSKLEPPAVLRGAGGGRPVMSSNFDDQPLDATPKGWKNGCLGSGAASPWRVIEEAGAPSGKRVLSVAGPSGAPGNWNLCIADDTSFPGDCISQVRIKSDGGAAAISGGIVFAYQDERNFYAAVLDFTTREAVLYKVENGRAVVLKKRDRDDPARAGVAIEAGKWHLLQAERQTTRVLVRVDGQERALLDSRDRTFTGGKVGVMTSGSAVTKFDDLTAEEPVQPSGR